MNNNHDIHKTQSLLQIIILNLNKTKLLAPTRCWDLLDLIFFRERASQLARKQEIGEKEIEGKSGRRGESRRRKAGGDLFVRGLAPPPPGIARGGHCSQPTLTPPFPPFPAKYVILMCFNDESPQWPRPRGYRKACFKEEASLTNFLFYGFLIKGLGAEIWAPED